MNEHLRKFVLLFVVFSFFQKSNAQDCDCTINEVKSNTVIPCDFTVGTIDTVFTTRELRDAIIKVNASNGNHTILIGNGTYPIASTSSYPYITASNVVFRSLSGNRDAVILTGQGMKDVAPLTENGIFAVGDNIVIANLTIRDVGNHAIAVTGDNLFVYNVKIQNSYEQMIKGNRDNDGSNFGQVKCSLFEYTEGIGPQWYIGGLDIHNGHNWIVSDNVFKDISSPSRSVAEHAIHFWNDGSDNVCERNHIINCDRGIGFGLGASPNTGGIIRNNMIYNNGDKPFNDVGISLETSPNTQVYNNTIYVAYPNAIEYRFAETFGVEITNNLCNKTIRSRNGGLAVLNNNLSTVSDNWFVDLPNGDLHLESNIPMVVDQGLGLADLKLDIDKTPRPQSAQVDIGAHELTISTNQKNLDDELNLSIFPNPFQNQIEIESTQTKEYQIEIYSTQFVLIKNINTLDSNSKLIKTDNWPTGNYFCKITEISNLEKVKWLKLVKTNY